MLRSIALVAIFVGASTALNAQFDSGQIAGYGLHDGLPRAFRLKM